MENIALFSSNTRGRNTQTQSSYLYEHSYCYKLHLLTFQQRHIQQI